MCNQSQRKERSFLIQAVGRISVHDSAKSRRSIETVIILSNGESNLPFFRAAVESILDDEDIVMPYEHKEVKIDTAILVNYVGKYFGGVTMQFIKKDGKLYQSS